MNALDAEPYLADAPSARRGDYIQTLKGRRFWPADPRPEEVDIEEIAHALSNLCRFTGHCSEFYSVAQHSVFVWQIGGRLPGRPGLWYLLHDASEAYTGDINRPLKRGLQHVTDAGPAPIHEVEALLMDAVAARLRLPSDPPWEAIKRADNIALATEVRDLMRWDEAIWGKWLADLPLWPEPVRPLEPTAAKALFLETFRVLEAA